MVLTHEQDTLFYFDFSECGNRLVLNIMDY